MTMRCDANDSMLGRQLLGEIRSLDAARGRGPRTAMTPPPNYKTASSNADATGPDWS